MDLVPDYPVVENTYQITNSWSIVLQERYNRRTEKGNMVIWRPGMTMWISVWKKDNKTKEETIAWLKGERSKDGYDEKEENLGNGIIRYSYKIREADENRTIKNYIGFYQYYVTDLAYAQCAVYCDTDNDIRMADGLRFTYVAPQK